MILHMNIHGMQVNCDILNYSESEMIDPSIYHDKHSV